MGEASPISGGGGVGGRRMTWLPCAHGAVSNGGDLPKGKLLYKTQKTRVSTAEELVKKSANLHGGS